jgi:hypothetical protein
MARLGRNMQRSGCFVEVFINVLDRCIYFISERLCFVQVIFLGVFFVWLYCTFRIISLLSFYFLNLLLLFYFFRRLIPILFLVFG